MKNQKTKIKKIPIRCVSRRRHDSKHVVGTLTVVRSGNGFVKPEPPYVGKDILIRSDKMGEAFDGDTVEAVISNTKNRPEGYIVGIVSRSGKNIVCTLRKKRGTFVAVPVSSKYRNVFDVANTADAAVGDRVTAKFLSYGGSRSSPRVEIVSVIGPEDDPATDTLYVTEQYGLPGEFPEAALSEARSFSTETVTVGKRLDLRKKLVFTIDPASAKDFDDAISIETDKHGQKVLGVHIADVSHYVRSGSALDREAGRRGTSVYLADKVIPMLPEELSNGACSLKEGEDRLAFSVFITFDGNGKACRSKFFKSVVRSSARLTYEQAQSMIDGGSRHGFSDAVVSAVRETFALTSVVRKARMANFSLDISIPELEFTFEDNLITGIRPAPVYPANEMIEEAMIAANEAVAREFSVHKIPYIARFHDAPDPKHLDELSDSLALLGLSIRKIATNRDISKLLKSVEGTPVEQYVSKLVLASMSHAEYSAENTGHFGLAKKYYAHFTAPIRRYPDLVSHRQLDWLSKREKQPSVEALKTMAEISTSAEYNAEQASRELVEIKKYRFLERQLRNGTQSDYESIIVKVMESGVIVEIPDLQIDGMVHVSLLSDKYLNFNPAKNTLSAPGISFAPGDKLKVYVAAIDPEARKIDFAPADGNVSSPHRQPIKKRRGGKCGCVTKKLDRRRIPSRR